MLPDPKDDTKDVVTFLDAAIAATSEEEAQQRGALAALHRVAGDRAMHRILPEDFLDLWEELGKQVQIPYDAALISGECSELYAV